MTSYEKLGSFYLGRERDAASGKTTDNLTLYDSSDLTTHAIIIGMTGSGKTGLAIDMIEEAAIDKVPVIAIDPKGDLANLLLTFPELRPEDFRPWIDVQAAERAGLSPDAFAAAEEIDHAANAPGILHEDVGELMIHERPCTATCEIEMLAVGLRFDRQ